MKTFNRVGSANTVVKVVVMTSALPSDATAANRASDQLRTKLTRNAEYFRREMTRLGFKLAGAGHPIIPVMLGEPEKTVQERLKSGQPTWRNPTERKGKRLWYTASIGSEPLLANVILERVKEAADAELRNIKS